MGDNKKGKIFVTYHKKFPVLTGSLFLPVHVGRDCSKETKDGDISADEQKWLMENLTGDNTGDHISSRNREFSECTGLYWFWKNYDYSNLDYVGCFQYRRQLVLNDLFDKAPENKEKTVYKCVHLNKSRDICTLAGISESRISKLIDVYDCILPHRTSLEKMGTHSTIEDYARNIPGVHLSDLYILTEVFRTKYPEEYHLLKEYLYSPGKLMYQVFILRKDIFAAYCEWLFDLLFEIDKNIDSSLYTVNGKRTMGYLAEILYGYYFSYRVTGLKVLHTGVTYLE